MSLESFDLALLGEDYNLVSSILSLMLSEKLAPVSAVSTSTIGKEEYMKRLLKAAADRAKRKTQTNIALSDTAKDRYARMMRNVVSPSKRLAIQAYKTKRKSGEWKFGDTQLIPRLEVSKESSNKYNLVSIILSEDI